MSNILPVFALAMNLVVVAAAAAASKRLRQEEEDMTPYTPQDIAEPWEFKILRSAASQFRNPAWLRSILEEEARAGWIMIEKFDNSRLRLKRLASARVNDATLGFDPYRTWVGISQTRFALMIVLGALGGTLALFLLIMLAAGAFSR
jgi:hypothetical protein